jgi:hypothetical protein
MKILFDNGTPKPIARCLIGHEITHARQIGWQEFENGELTQSAFAPRQNSRRRECLHAR